MIVIFGGLIHNTSTQNVPTNYMDEQMDGIVGHPLRSYLDYIGHFYQRMDPLPEQERFELSYRDFLQSPSQPLMDNVEVQTNETFEKDVVKYNQILNKEAIEASEKERPVPEIEREILCKLNWRGISKGLVVENLTSTMVCNEKPSDIVMCIGDDRLDEDMFEKVLSIINNLLLPAVPEIFACTVGQKPSKAKYYLDDTFEV
ncbi:hypothetical protein GIB67_001447, partial [Kingdonia uniflora]